MSEVEQFWVAICKKTGDTRKWNDLNGNQQLFFIQGINLILSVVNHRDKCDNRLPICEAGRT